MTNLLYLTTVIVTALSCNQPASSDFSNHKQETAASGGKVEDLPHAGNPGNLLILADAEMILGEPAHLSDSSTSASGEALFYHCAYTANSKDGKSGKTGVVYFLFEIYNDVAPAQKKYTTIMKANEDHGISVMELGDESYFHTDSVNFYFIMVRKNNKVFNMKVNKITSFTSIQQFKLVAKKITDAL